MPPPQKCTPPEGRQHDPQLVGRPRTSPPAVSRYPGLPEGPEGEGPLRDQAGGSLDPSEGAGLHSFPVSERQVSWV